MRYTQLLALVWILNAGAQAEAKAQGVRQACAPTSDTLPASATTKGMAGTYQLTIVGTGGKAADQRTRGTLKLWAPPNSFQIIRWPGGRQHPHLTIPLIGTAQIYLGRVGGLKNGGWTSPDPAAPGIAVSEWHDTSRDKPRTNIELHLGANGNRRSRRQLDGPYNALYVDKVDSNGFWGRWHASLGYSTYKADGYFCAIRD